MLEVLFSRVDGLGGMEMFSPDVRDSRCMGNTCLLVKYPSLPGDRTNGFCWVMIGVMIVL